MTERFELKINFTNGQLDIVDWLESRQKDAICIYNDLGVLPFSSAKAVCELLNKLHDENEELKQDLEEYCNFSLHDVLDKKNKEIERLQSTLTYRSNKLTLMEQLIDDLGHEEMRRQMWDILNG